MPQNHQALLEYRTVNVSKNKRQLKTPDNQILLKENNILPKQVSQFQKPDKLQVGTIKILKVNEIIGKKMCPKKQIDLLKVENERTSKSKKKLDLSLTRKRQRSKSHKSGIRLCPPRNDSLRKIKSFRLMDVEKDQIQMMDEEKIVKIKTPKRKNNIQIPQKEKKTGDFQRKKIKLSKLR